MPTFAFRTYCNSKNRQLETRRTQKQTILVLLSSIFDPDVIGRALQGIYHFTQARRVPVVECNTQLYVICVSVLGYAMLSNNVT